MNDTKAQAAYHDGSEHMKWTSELEEYTQYMLAEHGCNWTIQDDELTAGETEFLNNAPGFLGSAMDEVERLRAEVARLRGLADDDDAVDRAAVRLCANGRYEDIWAILDDPERNSFRDDARAALRAALNPEAGE